VLKRVLKYVTGNDVYMFVLNYLVEPMDWIVV